VYVFHALTVEGLVEITYDNNIKMDSSSLRGFRGLVQLYCGSGVLNTSAT
jgi:hypothetical protein